MPKFLAGCHFNEEEISRHLKKYIEYWPVQINDNKFATGQILKKPVEVEGADFSWLSSKVTRTLLVLCFEEGQFYSADLLGLGYTHPFELGPHHYYQNKGSLVKIRPP